MEESKKGGKRANSGRKPLSDPKKPITIYVPKSKITFNGGEDKLKLKIYDVISKDFVTTQRVEERITTTQTPELEIPTEVQKTVQEWVNEKRDILIPELYEDFIDRLNKVKYLTDKQKAAIKYA